jgi:hypothetical protein
MSNGFKEWALVCDALGRGEQSLILRKGGIAEGRAGFRFQHEDFLLLPTLFHEQAAQLKVAPDIALPTRQEGDDLQVNLRAVAEWAVDVTDLETLHRLEPFHLWRDELVQERFHYKDDLRLSVAFVRIYRLSRPFTFPDSPKYGGCRSWVTLPELPSDITSTPVLDDATHAARAAALREILSAPVSAGAMS